MRITPRPLVVTVALAALCPSCSAVTTELPGVLDLRSDGADAPALATSAVARTGAAPAREGLDAMLGGSGPALVDGGKRAEARTRVWWLLHATVLGELHAKDDVAAALGPGGAWRGVTVGEELSTPEALAFACGLPIPCVDVAVVLFMPTLTLTASGARIEPVAEAANPALVPPPPPPPTPTPSLDRPARKP